MYLYDEDIFFCKQGIFIVYTSLQWDIVDELVNLQQYLKRFSRSMVAEEPFPIPYVLNTRSEERCV